MTDTGQTSQSKSQSKSPTKSAKAFRTISEAAGELDLPQHVLRFWETKFPQIKPMKRAGGRRFYRPEDVDMLARIKTLLHTEGYTIKGVQKLLRQSGGQEPPPVSGQEVQPAVSENTSQPDKTPDQSPDSQSVMIAEITRAITTLESVRTDLLSVRKSS